MMAPNQAQDLRDVMVNTLIKAVDGGVNLVALVSDSTSTAKIAPFNARYPDRLVNVGIAEQSLVGTAAGMALGGFVAVTANAAPFLVHRANEQVKNDVCYTNSNVKLVGLNAGVCYGPLASTHHAIDDLSIMLGFGNILILAPSDPLEAEQIFSYAMDYEGPVYIRMDSAKFPALHQDDYRFEPGKADVLQPGQDIAIFAVGSTVHEAVAAGRMLDAQGISAEVVNLSSIRPLDRQGIIRSLRKTGLALTVEEHSLHGGIGSLVSEITAEEGLPCRVKRLGFTEGQFAVPGPRGEMRAQVGIDAPGIVDTAKELINQSN
jgi:transketolase